MSNILDDFVHKHEEMKSQVEELRYGVHDFIDKNCLFRANSNKTYFEGLPPGRFYGLTGQSTWQFYLRRATHDFLCLHAISSLIVANIIEKMKEGKLTTFQLCGMETGSLSLIAGIQMIFASNKIGVNAFSIRKKRKHYGLFNFIEGTPTDAPVIFVDDLVNSGSSILRAAETCFYELRLPFAGYVYCIVDINKSSKKTIEYHKNKTLEVVSLFDRNDFDFSFDVSKYWEPKDVDLSENKRPDYK